MKNLNPLEKVIEGKVRLYARERKVLVYKFTSPGNASVPDRVFVAPGGIVWWIEFKRRGEKPTPKQAVEIAKLRAQGAKVFVVDNVEEGKRVVDEMLKDPCF